MNRFPCFIVLEHENAWPFRISWIILDLFRIRNSCDDFPNGQTVRRKLIISVLGDSHLGGRDEPQDPVNRSAQRLFPRVGLILNFLVAVTQRLKYSTPTANGCAA